jgi:hypothetical protein
MDSLQREDGGVEPITGLCRFRNEFYSCLGTRADAQFELTDALLCADGPVRTLVDLSQAPEHRLELGALYDGLNHGKIEIVRLRRGVARLPRPRVGELIVLAADARRGCVRTPRPKPGAMTTKRRYTPVSSSPCLSLNTEPGQPLGRQRPVGWLPLREQPLWGRMVQRKLSSPKTCRRG